MVNIIRKTNWEISELYEHCLHAGIIRILETTETAEVTLSAGTGAAEGLHDGAAAVDGANGDEHGSGDKERTPAEKAHSLMERGVALHSISADEADETDEEMEERELTPEEAAAATAVLDAPDHDQEGLPVTGGDWFKTIRQAAKNNKETEKELAAGMKKAKLSQTSLENEVFEREPSNQSSADAGPGLLQYNSKKTLPLRLPDTPTAPLHTEKEKVRL